MEMENENSPEETKINAKKIDHLTGLKLAYLDPARVQIINVNEQDVLPVRELKDILVRSIPYSIINRYPYFTTKSTLTLDQFLGQNYISEDTRKSEQNCWLK